MSEHTAGKLRFERQYSNGCEIGPYLYADDQWIAYMAGAPYLGFEETVPNARRLVACWNLCDGVPTEQIEAAPDLGRLLAEREEMFHGAPNLARIIAEHGEMLAACKAFLAYDRSLGDGRGESNYVLLYEEAYEKISRAVAKAESTP